ncbi:HECT-domain-containing protein [Mariannaea sp. PMI_226]|nr:HECT-domain-containing protein [Mariannaea sp. PMI_226]
MTRQRRPSVQTLKHEAIRTPSSPLDSPSDLDLLSGLWQEAPFARLPPDAPAELDKYVQNIDNPSRVYAIHKASRRQGFQLLVEKYILQLRTGCGQPDCTTQTCFSCRKRLVGRAPMRRYNPTSARTLAIYLASQDNPEVGLCPNLQKPKEPPASVKNLFFSARSPSPSPPEYRRSNFAATSSPRRKSQNDNSQLQDSQPKTGHPVSTLDANGFRKPEDKQPQSLDSLERLSGININVTEGPVSKDHRSFAANLFGTVAFKMLEWLTPRGIEAMTEQISNLEKGSAIKKETQADADMGPLSKPDQPRSSAETRSQSSNAPQSTREPDAKVHPPHPSAEACVSEKSQLEGSNVDKTKSRHVSIPKTRNSTSRPKRSTSLESFPPPPGPEDSKTTILSPRLNAFHEKPVRPKTNSTVSGRGIPEVPTKPAFFENVPHPNPRLLQEVKSIQVSLDEYSPKDTSEDAPVMQPQPKPTSTEQPQKDKTEIPDSWLNNASPQALSRLDVEIIDFMCNVLQEDGTSENEFALASQLSDTIPKPLNPSKPLARIRSKRAKSSKKKWRDFSEQTIFNVLSSPHAIIESFTRDGKLYDSQTLWYCLHRLSRVMPSLVFHSLWVAAGSLFIPPASMRSQASTKESKFAQRSQTRLSEVEAGHLMSICMHALVAAAPIIPDSRALYELSRIRSIGLTLATGSAVARQPAPRCLEYDDTFTNALAVRLARRLFCAIPIRRYFVEMDNRGKNAGVSSNADILRLLVNQLDILSAGSARILEFPQSEYLLHETRVPTVLLDWARTVILDEWNGQPDFSLDGPFGGALSFIETMHQKRNLLLLGDIQFRVDYLSDRLDSIEMPVEWLDFKSTQWRRHILDYPYIFSSDTLVSFFRSINFARMSRMFEESSSLKSRMSAIVDPGSLITNPHHKMVLQDLLRTASSKYLILQISRDHVVRDAFDQLWRREMRELLRPLKVHLGEDVGEEGFDSGGVQQEFFRLAIAECLDPKYGAFTVDERTRMVWFAPGSLTEEWKFELVGLLMSLALYNGLTLPITFPKALYRKLLGKPVEELHHIADGWPELANGLTTLLEWDEKDGLVEDIFARTYEFSVSTLGTNVTREMTHKNMTWPKAAAYSEDMAPPNADNPDDAPMVTNNNRDAYVNDYIRYLTDVSIRPQFKAFERGFQTCLSQKSLSLLSPPILQSLVEGVQDIDISELRRYARYVGWDASHHTIKDFWSIVKRYDDEMKRKLLEFVTSSDRVPVGGMKNLQFVIQKNGQEGEGGHLPTAYTCYGTLLLPEYRDKEVLRERLGMALDNAQGFGFA